ncbi:hypothetical protein Y1Q_0021914 [Alligator mississippiensis]|uniref:Uncharacterized protein n=1 Tax=Alligator mississippiensis TaxID=8496 RepID=A0A151MTR4_ALLMI|nr:hypothetical protein Y1Q_0021914 [Alligator mississippiensis]
MAFNLHRSSQNGRTSERKLGAPERDHGNRHHQMLLHPLALAAPVTIPNRQGLFSLKETLVGILARPDRSSCMEKVTQPAMKEREVLL